MTASGSADRPRAAVDERLDKMISGIPRPVDWRHLPAIDSRARWDALDSWTRWLVDRYALDTREVPACWYLHGAAVEELSALHGAWLIDFDRNQAASAAADWHSTLSATRLRLRDWLSRTGCTNREHRDDSSPDWVTAAEPYTSAFRLHAAADHQMRSRAEISGAAKSGTTNP